MNGLVLVRRVKFELRIDLGYNISNFKIHIHYLC